jgi:hypothetical protein
MQILKVVLLGVALTGVASPSQAFLLLLGAGGDAPEPKNEVTRVGPLKTTQELARVVPPSPVFKLPEPTRLQLAQSNGGASQTRDVPYWRIELHPRNAGAVLTDPARVVFASPGKMTGAFQVQIPQSAVEEIPTWVYRKTGIFTATEQGNYSFSLTYKCAWWCRLRMVIGGQEVINLPNVGGLGDRTERFSTALAPGEYPIEVEWGFNNPRQISHGVRSETFLNVLARGPGDDTLGSIKIFNRVPVSRAAVPVPLN